MELAVDELCSSSCFTLVQQGLLHLDSGTSDSWSALITWALKGLVRGRIWLQKSQLPAADSRNGTAFKHMVHDSKQFFNSENQSKTVHEGRGSNLTFSCKNLVCSEKNGFLLLVIVKCNFLYNKCPFTELKWKLLSCDPAINMLILVWGMLEFTYHSPRRRKMK